MTSDDDPVEAVHARVWLVAGVLMAHRGLDERSAYALIVDEWAARDLPLDVVVQQLFDETVTSGDQPALRFGRTTSDPDD